MNTPSNVMPESSVESQVMPLRPIPAMRRIYWAVRREFWENRAIYVAPLAVATLFLFGFAISMVHLPQRVRATAFDTMKQHETIVQPYDMAAALLMGTFLIVAVFYCIEALQRERRDRSILFWKSLPVSDFTTVAAKASIPFVVLPLLTFAVTVVTQFIMLSLSSAVLAVSGLSVTAYWAQVSLVQSSLLLLYHLATVHVLGCAPAFAWLLLVSAWARRAALLWAVLPPLAVCALEKLLFNTAHFAESLERLLTGSGTEAVMAPGTLPMDPHTHITPEHFLGSPGLWIGLAFAGIFLAAAVRVRRYREPI